jgi:hypothetical protein
MTPLNEKGKEKSEATNVAQKSLVERLTLWIGIIGSVITLTLTIYNYRTKTQIDEAEARLKVVQADVATKAEQREANPTRRKACLQLYRLRQVKSYKLSAGLV